jgi:hypothetical protein
MRAAQTDGQTSVKYIYRPAAHDRCRGRDVAVAGFSGGLSPSGTTNERIHSGRVTAADFKMVGALMVVAFIVGVLMVLTYRVVALTVLTYLVTATRGGSIYGGDNLWWWHYRWEYSWC